MQNTNDKKEKEDVTTVKREDYQYTPKEGFGHRDLNSRSIICYKIESRVTGLLRICIHKCMEGQCPNQTRR